MDVVVEAIDITTEEMDMEDTVVDILERTFGHNIRILIVDETENYKELSHIYR